MRYVAPAGFSIKKDCTGGGRMASGDDVVQGRFSGTVTSDNGYEITFIDCKIDVFKGAVFVGVFWLNVIQMLLSVIILFLRQQDFAHCFCSVRFSIF